MRQFNDRLRICTPTVSSTGIDELLMHGEVRNPYVCIPGVCSRVCVWVGGGCRVYVMGITFKFNQCFRIKAQPDERLRSGRCLHTSGHDKSARLSDENHLRVVVLRANRASRPPGAP